jgi:hypothetical protein
MKLTKTLGWILGLVGAIAVLTPAPSQAALGDSLFATGGTITATFEGSDAGYDSQLALVVTSASYSSAFIFPNHSTAVGTTFDFGSFSAGAALDFQLYVVNTGYTWHTGPGSGNADGIAHANVIYNFPSAGKTFVGFEDLYGGGDFDYNDHMFSFTNVSAIPEPETYAMLLAGLGLLGFAARRRKLKLAA